jgi:hypothetical protein
MACDQRRNASEFGVVDQHAHRPLQRLQPVSRKADRLWGDDGILRPQTYGPPSSVVITSTSTDRRARACISPPSANIALTNAVMGRVCAWSQPRRGQSSSD